MFGILRPIWVVSAILVCIWLHATRPALADAQVEGPDWATKAVLYNASNADVICLVTLGKSGTGTAPTLDGCPSQVNFLQVKNLTTGESPAPLTQFTNPQIGWFKLSRGHKVQLISLATDPRSRLRTYCLSNVNLGFGAQAANCPLVPTPIPVTTPGSTFNNIVNVLPPNGTNGAELTLNTTGLKNGGQVAGATNEAVDITCLSGANSKVVMLVTPPASGPYWTDNRGAAGGGAVAYRSTVSLENSWVKVDRTSGCDDNCVDPRTGLPRSGVYPYGCSQCNTLPDPGPACNGKGPYPAQFCAVKNGLPANTGCLLARAPLINSVMQNSANQQVGFQKFGGTVQINYMGPISPPVKCP